MSGTLRQFCVVMIAWAAAALFSGCPIDPGIDVENPAGVALGRAAGAFVPGQEFSITVTISAEDGASISALGLTETVPEGWSFVAADGANGARPVIMPGEGDTGELGFLWVAVPEFPVSFTYTLLVPEDAAATIEITGRVDYHQALGLLSSDDTVSSFSRDVP